MPELPEFSFTRQVSSKLRYVCGATRKVLNALPLGRLEATASVGFKIQNCFKPFQVRRSSVRVAAIGVETPTGPLAGAFSGRTRRERNCTTVGGSKTSTASRPRRKRLFTSVYSAVVRP